MSHFEDQNEKSNQVNQNAHRLPDWFIAVHDWLLGSSLSKIIVMFACAIIGLAACILGAWLHRWPGIMIVVTLLSFSHGALALDAYLEKRQPRNPTPGN